VKRSIRQTFRVAAVGVAVALPLAACGGERENTQAAATRAGKQQPPAESAAAGAPTPPKAAPAAQPSDPAAFARLMAMDTAGAAEARRDSTKRWLAGTSPLVAIEEGWPVKMETPLAGSLLPYNRIVAYYGNPLSKRMGVLGEYPKEEMLARFDRQIAAWNQADPAHPVLPALHMVTVVAQGDPGPSGLYRTIMRDSLIEQVHGWAKSRKGIFIIDIQTGKDRIQNLLPRFEKYLKEPDIHLAVDPEFMMVYNGARPGTKIGTMRASDVNYVIQHLTEIVRQNNLPPKILIIHRFTRGMVPDAENIRPTPQVQVVMDMDGWGAPWLKRDSYRDYIVRHPVQFTGFKLFYHNDTKKGDALMSPADVMQLRPVPRYIQYQ
jgi:hypothetical protein